MSNTNQTDKDIIAFKHTRSLQNIPRDKHCTPCWELVAAVLIRGDNEPEFKNSKLYLKADWLSYNTGMTFNEWLIRYNHPEYVVN